MRKSILAIVLLAAWLTVTETTKTQQEHVAEPPAFTVSKGLERVQPVLER